MDFIVDGLHLTHRIAELPKQVGRVRTLGQLMGRRQMRDSNDNLMSFLTIYDGEDSMDVTVFSRDYLDYKHLLKKHNLLIVAGKMSQHKSKWSITASTVEAVVTPECVRGWDLR